MRIDVTISTTGAVAMLDRLAARAGNLTPALERAGDQSSQLVTGIPVDTGELAASPKPRVQGDEVQIVSDVPYARFVFRGTRYMPARPPTVNAAAIAQLAADEVAREVFG